MAEKQLRIRISAEDAASPIFRKVGDTAEQTQKRLIGIGKLGGLRGLESFEAGGMIGKGGFAAAAAVFASRALADVAKTTNQIATDIRLSEKSAGELFDQFARGLPVLGNIYAAGRDIREIFTGEEAGLELAKRGAARWDAYYATIANGGKVAKEAVADLNEELKKLDREYVLMLADKKDLPVAVVRQSQEQAQERLRQGVDAQVSAIRDAYAKGKDGSMGLDQLRGDRKQLLDTAGMSEAGIEKEIRDYERILANADWLQRNGPVGGGYQQKLDQLRKYRTELSEIDSQIANAESKRDAEIRDTESKAAAARESSARNAQERILQLEKEQTKARADERKDVEARYAESIAQLKIDAERRAGNEMAAATAEMRLKVNAELAEIDQQIRTLREQTASSEEERAQIEALIKKLEEQRRLVKEGERDAFGKRAGGWLRDMMDAGGKWFGERMPKPEDREPMQYRPFASDFGEGDWQNVSAARLAELSKVQNFRDQGQDAADDGSPAKLIGVAELIKEVAKDGFDRVERAIQGGLTVGIPR